MSFLVVFDCLNVNLLLFLKIFILCGRNANIFICVFFSIWILLDRVLWLILLVFELILIRSRRLELLRLILLRFCLRSLENLRLILFIVLERSCLRSLAVILNLCWILIWIVLIDAIRFLNLLHHILHITINLIRWSLCWHHSLGSLILSQSSVCFSCILHMRLITPCNSHSICLAVSSLTITCRSLKLAVPLSLGIESSRSCCQSFRHASVWVYWGGCVNWRGVSVSCTCGLCGFAS